MVFTLSIGLIFLIIFSLITIYIIKRRKVYTRERFAFFATGLFISFCIFVISHLYSDNSLLITVIKLFNLLPLDDIEVPTTDWTGRTLSVVVLIFLGSFISAIYNKWDGGKSQKDLELENKNRNYDFMEALFNGATIKKIEIIKDEDRDKENNFTEELDYLDENKDWHTEAKELLRLKSKQFKINSEEDWHSIESLYISKYSNKDIAIYCTLTMPEDAEIIKKIDFLNTTYKEKEFLKIIVMTKKDTKLKEIKTKQLNDITIEYITQDLILNSLIDFSEYFDYIEDQFLKKEITSGDNLRLQDTYVEPRGKLIDTKDEKEIDHLEKYLLNWVKEPKIEHHISLLGEYGQGKSVLSLKIALEMIKNEYNRIPIIIELRGKSPKNENILSIISSWSSKFDISAKAIEKLLHAGKLLIILEGFDEMDLVGDKYTRHNHFKRLLEFMRYEKSKVIITGRPNLFLDTEEMKRFLNFDKNSNQIFYSKPIHLLPLNKEQIELSLRNVDIYIKNEILKLVNSRNNTSFNDLISRPSTLYQTSIIWNTLDKENINSSTVINSFIKHSYKRQELKLSTIGKTGVTPTLTTNEREYFMIGIAASMISNNNYTNQINKNDLETTVSKLYYDIPNEISHDQENNIPLKKRLNDYEHAIETVFNDVRTSGILVKDLSGTDSFKFAHKSFLEFLFALFFVHKIYQEDEYYRIISNSVFETLSISDIYDIKLSKEVISFISSYFLNLFSQDKEYKSQESFKVFDKYLVKYIRPKLRLNIIQRILFDEKFKKFILFVIPISMLFLTLLFYIYKPKIESYIDITIPFINNIGSDVLNTLLILLLIVTTTTYKSFLRKKIKSDKITELYLNIYQSILTPNDIKNVANDDLKKLIYNSIKKY